MKFENGKFYTGSWEEGSRCGYGQSYESDGTIYRGEHQNGDYNCLGFYWFNKVANNA